MWDSLAAVGADKVARPRNCFATGRPVLVSSLGSIAVAAGRGLT
jgi:hypothetical protein